MCLKLLIIAVLAVATFPKTTLAVSFSSPNGKVIAEDISDGQGAKIRITWDEVPIPDSYTTLADRPNQYILYRWGYPDKFPRKTICQRDLASTKRACIDLTAVSGRRYSYELAFYLEDYKNNKFGSYGLDENYKVTAVSLDKLAPSIPNNVSSKFESGVLVIDWLVNQEKDVASYEVNLYKERTAKAPVITLNPTENLLYLEKPSADYQYFTLAARDSSGNLSNSTQISKINRLSAIGKISKQSKPIGVVAVIALAFIAAFIFLRERLLVQRQEKHNSPILPYIGFGIPASLLTYASSTFEMFGEAAPIWLLPIIWLSVFVFGSLLYNSIKQGQSMQAVSRENTFLSTFGYAFTRIAIVAFSFAMMSIAEKFISVKFFAGIMALFWIPLLVFLVYKTIFYLFKLSAYGKSIRQNPSESNLVFLWRTYKKRKEIFSTPGNIIPKGDPIGRTYKVKFVTYISISTILLFVVMANYFEFGFSGNFYGPSVPDRYVSKEFGLELVLQPPDNKWHGGELLNQNYLSFDRRSSNGGQGVYLEKFEWIEDNPKPLNLNAFYEHHLTEQERLDKTFGNKTNPYSQKRYVRYNNWVGITVYGDEQYSASWTAFVANESQYYEISYGYRTDWPKENNIEYNRKLAKKHFDNLLKSVKFRN
ncbi:MAG: hypothetical protein Q7S37_00440 [bacterium]|nr:hypothetical protein [bacterium]